MAVAIPLQPYDSASLMRQSSISPKPGPPTVQSNHSTACKY